MFAFREKLNARRDELAAILTSEHGKVLGDAAGEVARGIEVVEFACAMPQLMKGAFSENVSTGVDVYSLKQPLGVVGIISPFNFPAMVPMWFFPIAIAAGNTVVLKPSEKDPSVANWMAELLTESGLPDGVFNVVHGDKVAVDAMLDHPDVASISFVGSTPIARYVYEKGTAAGKRVQALGGAKNHMLVLPDADLDLVADSAVNAGFGSAGERCMAISVVLAVDPVGDELVGKIQERMAGLVTGDGRRSCDMGPLITREHRDKVAGYLDVAGDDGATVVVDGRDVKPDADGDGFFLGPSLVDHVPTSSTVYQDEIFGPVLSIVRVDSYDEGMSAHQRQRVRQRHRDLHQRRRRRPALPARGAGRHGRRQRADPGARGLPLLRRLEGLTVRRRQGLRPARRRLLHPREGRHRPLARPEPRRPQPGLPAERLSDPAPSRGGGTGGAGALGAAQAGHGGVVEPTLQALLDGVAQLLLREPAAQARGVPGGVEPALGLRREGPRRLGDEVAALELCLGPRRRRRGVEPRLVGRRGAVDVEHPGLDERPGADPGEQGVGEALAGRGGLGVGVAAGPQRHQRGSHRGGRGGRRRGVGLRLAAAVATGEGDHRRPTRPAPA